MHAEVVDEESAPDQVVQVVHHGAGEEHDLEGKKVFKLSPPHVSLTFSDLVPLLDVDHLPLNVQGLVHVLDIDKFVMNSF